MDWAEEIGFDLVLDLLVRQAFGDAEQAVAAIVDDHIDASELVKRFGDRPLHSWRVGHIHLPDPEVVAVPVGQILEGCGITHCCRDAVTRRETLLGHLAAETAIRASDKPCAGHRCNSIANIRRHL